MADPQLFPSAPRRVSLIKLSGEIARAVATFGRVAVEGEVYQPRTLRSGTMFFTLRDRAAQIRVVVPGRRAARSRVVAGERVEVVGSVRWDNEYGQLQVEADEVAPVGEGAIAALVAQARERLQRDGMLDRPRHRLPRLPRCIGVICGADAAVRHDIQSVVDVQFPGYPMEFAETTVSGPGAVDAIVAALAVMNATDGVDVVIVARGGGDAAQLRPFSDEAVCRAICASRVPVVSAIGHEGDRPLCDEVADHRFGTPSIAARHVVPDRVALLRELDVFAERIAGAVHHRLDASEARLAAIEPRRALRDGVATAERRLSRAADRLAVRHPRVRLASAGARLEGLHRGLEALSPTRVLERGYAIVRTDQASVVRDAAVLHAGASVSVQFAAGSARARVEEVSPS
jgi:exodeoxyribonuclease VII large subunit